MKYDFTIAEDGKWTAAASAETTSLPIIERYGANLLLRCSITPDGK